MTIGVFGVARGQALPPVPVPTENPITEGKRVLGKILFWDEQLSVDNTVSCGTCHQPSSAGTDPLLAIGPGADNLLGTPDDIRASFGVARSDAATHYEPDDVFEFNAQVTTRAANSALLAMYAPELFWDGRASSTFVDPETGFVSIVSGGALESQLVQPIVSDVEMGHENRDWTEIVAKLEGAYPLAIAEDLPPDVAAAIDAAGSYPALFETAFGTEDITAERIAFAIATYERTLVPDETPWDRFMAGDATALTPGQVQGWNAFAGSNCAVCHRPPLFTDSSFRNIAVRPAAEDLGRGDVTGDPIDNGRFKVPSLRNAGLKASFTHTGQFTDLNQVLAFYRGPGAPGNVRSPLLPVAFPPDVNPAVIDFISNGLTDPRVAAGTFPFDRPTLRSEIAPANPTPIGGGTPGAGGLVPRMIATCPPNLGNGGFKLGVHDALGGAQAFVAFSSAAPIGGVVSPDQLEGPVMLEGVGVGEGYGTLEWPIPADATREGEVLYAQWRVSDPSAPGGVALSDAAQLTLFCGNCAAPPPTCLGDLDGDNDTDIFDFGIFAVSLFGQTVTPGSAGDYNADGVVNVLDFAYFAADFGCTS
jgi:cytochrome c peroxidase